MDQHKDQIFAYPKICQVERHEQKELKGHEEDYPNSPVFFKLIERALDIFLPFDQKSYLQKPINIDQNGS
jgi:hypothetical protein